jgi:uncharacterized membrane protein YfcA
MNISASIVPDDAAADVPAPMFRRPPIPWRNCILWGVLGVGTIVCLALSGDSNGPAAAMIAAILLASVLSSIAGFAFSAICGAMLFHLSGDPVQVVQIMMVCSIANQTSMVWAIRRTVQWRRLGIFLAGGVVGLPIGIGVLLCLDRHVYTRALGLFLMIYGGYMLLRRPVVLRRQPAALDMLVGFIGGITGGTVGFPGASITIWCSFKGWSKQQQRAVFQPFILIMQVAALVAISVVRRSYGTAGIDPADLWYVPAGLLGTMLGMACYSRLSDRHFAGAVNILLIVSGLSYAL